jgi:hypothetical protein
MNPLFIPVILGTIAFFFVGTWLSRRAQSGLQTVILVTISFLTAVPAVLYVVFYSGVLGETKWFYTFRAIPGTEFAACSAGLLAGWLQSMRSRSHQVRKQMSAGFIPFMLLLCVTLPYLKQLFLKPNWDGFSDRWSENVCLQSSESSCGPASAATLLRFFGKPASEKQIAQDSFTSRRGTENWFLIRTMRRLGLNAQYSIQKTGNVDLPYPAIVGVRLGGEHGTGHYIAVLGRIPQNEKCFAIGDPLNGREQLTEQELLNRYYFTGFAIIVGTNQP